jgi:carbonic anhydrase
METQHSKAGTPSNPDDAVRRLIDGNDYGYREGQLKIASLSPQNWIDQRKKLNDDGQAPWGVVWSCIDSRVPPELIFNCELGDLFVIRTAGQVSDGAALGSLEFAVSNKLYPVKVVVVMGHTECGAVKAAIPDPNPPAAHGEAAPASKSSIHVLVEAITPAYNQVMAASKNQPALDAASLRQKVIEQNIANQVRDLRANDIVGGAERAHRIYIVGAIYDLATGKATFGIE